MRTSFFVTLAIFLVSALPVQAADNSLNARVEGCLKDSACSVELKLQLLNELHADMGAVLRSISRKCETMNFQDCIAPQQTSFGPLQSTQQSMTKLLVALQDGAPLLAKSGSERKKNE